jgi:hypothetical protein
MDADEFIQRWHGLHAFNQYLVECMDNDGGANFDEIYELMIASAELVRDAGGDVRQYIESVCEALPVADVAVKQQLRDELWTKLSL